MDRPSSPWLLLSCHMHILSVLEPVSSIFNIHSGSTLSHHNYHHHHLHQAFFSYVSYSDNAPLPATVGLIVHTTAQSGSFRCDSVTRYACPEHFKGFQVCEKQNIYLHTGTRGLRRWKSQPPLPDHSPWFSSPSSPLPAFLLSFNLTLAGELSAQGLLSSRNFLPSNRHTGHHSSLFKFVFKYHFHKKTFSDSFQNSHLIINPVLPISPTISYLIIILN